MRRVWIGLAVFCFLAPIAAPEARAQDDAAKVLIYSGTTGYRHAGAGEAIQPAVVDLIRSRLLAAGIESDYRSCNGQGTGAGALPGCRNPDVGNPAIFTAANLAQYDAIFFWQASSRFRDDTTGQRLFTDAEQDAIEAFVHAGGGVAAMHASVTMGAGQVTWPWWDAAGDSAIGALMPGHSATDVNNVATVQVSDRHHPSTRDLPDSYAFGDEHYTFSKNVRGTHHVLMTLDEGSYNVGNGVTRMGADHPIAWCRMYEGGRIWASSLGHFASSYLENGGDNNLIKHLVGGVRWVAGTAGKDSDCGATVWSNFRRTVLADDLRGAIGLDIARDGKVYWTEIGDQGIASEGRLRMYDPESEETSTLLTLQTRADHQSSNDGVLGMALDPAFDDNRHLYVYYSPRQDPGCNSCIHLGHNVISRFTLNAQGNAVVPGSEQEILRVPKVKVGNNNSDGVPNQTTYGAHVGGGTLSFDSDGNLYVGTGDDVDPFGQGAANYAPLDQRYPQRYDAATRPRTPTTGARFDCAAAQIPNESPNNSGLPDVPGPAVPADVWHKRTGDHPARFAIPAQSAPQESITGPVYDYDADNPSETKWPAYYDGAWLILDRAQNWWREARVKDDGSELLRVNGMFGTTQFGSPSHSFPIPVKFGPDGSLYVATWQIDCCRTSLPGSGPGRLMRVDFIGDQADTTAPEVEASLAGPRNGEGDYVGRATLTLSATDTSGVDAIEYSLDGGADWVGYDGPVAFDEPGSYTVHYRATDLADPPNTSAVEEIAFAVVAGEGCPAPRSDEFDGTAVDAGRWSFRHPTTPAVGAGAPSVGGGTLALPLGGFSVDLTRPGPIGFLAQPLPDEDFELTARISAPGLDADVGGQGSAYAQAGLMIYQSDDDWIKIAHTRNADGGPAGSANTYFELAYETGGVRTLGTRMGLAPPATNLPTWWMRVIRSGSAISAAYSLTDPDGPGGAQWLDLGLAPDVDQLMPAAGGTRYIGAYGGNGSVTAEFDHVRFDPDVGTDTAAPVTGHVLAPAEPDGLAGWYRSPVEVALEAADEGACATGVDRTEYRIDGAAQWLPYDAPFSVSGDGEHTVHYRSVDVAGNGEPQRSTTVRIDATPPVTTATLSPADPGAGGTYATGPVAVGLSATDATVRGGGHRVPARRWRVDRVPPAHAAERLRARRAHHRVPHERQRRQRGAGRGGHVHHRGAGAALARGLRVSGRCSDAASGRLRLTVSKRTARKLGLGGRQRILAARSRVRCEDGRFAATLRPKGKAKRALRKLRGRIVARIELRMTGAGGVASDSAKLTVRGRRAKA